MPIKKCIGYPTPDGKKNIKCERSFWVENKNWKIKTLCSSCQRLKNNIYHKNYLRKWRERNKQK